MSEPPGAARWLRCPASASPSKAVLNSTKIQNRDFSNRRIHTTGGRARVATLAGIQHTYPWLAEQVRKARYADIQAVYLFDSMARGAAHTGSDLDLAIVPRGPSLRPRKLDLLTDLARHGFCDVDLVFLDTDDIVTRYEAVRLNMLVYAAADFDRGALYSRVVRQYLDFLPYLNVQRAAYKRSILGGQG
jgi:uncharacterized protein